jgi:hypothetical protein
MPGKRGRVARVGMLAVIGVLAITLVGPAESQRVTPGASAEAPAATKARIQEAFANLPLSFIENQGQVDGRVAYYVQGGHTTVYFTPGGLTIALTGPADPATSAARQHRAVARPVAVRRPDPDRARPRWAVKLDFVGANPNVRPRGLDPTPALISDFRGPRDRWRTLTTYASLVYSDLWPGTDLVFTGTANRLKYTFLLRPGADPQRIRLAYRGATAVTLTSEGELDVATPVGSFRDARPSAHQEVGGRRHEVAAAYALTSKAANGTHSYGFSLGAYDRSQPLVLDPTFQFYGGYIGGFDLDEAFGIAVDLAGNAYVAGTTASAPPSFPVRGGPAAEQIYDGNDDAFVAKVNAAGSALVYAFYLGGSGLDEGFGIAVDGASPPNAYVTGVTDSVDFPRFPATLGPATNAGFDAFVVKVNGAGTALVYARYLGGAGEDQGFGIAVDGTTPNANAYITGRTDSATFPEAAPPPVFSGGRFDAYVAKLTGTGTVAWVRYLGGAGEDQGTGIALRGTTPDAFVTGFTDSLDFPNTTPPIKDAGFDAFVARLDGATGDSTLAPRYVRFVGGERDDAGFGIAVDAGLNAYITGHTNSELLVPALPVLSFDRMFFGGEEFDAFVAKVNATGTTLVYASYLGGDGDDAGLGIAVDSLGRAHVTGITNSRTGTFPVIGATGQDRTFSAGGFDGFVARVNSAGTLLDYSGYLGGPGEDWGLGIALDSFGDTYVAGFTSSAAPPPFLVSTGPDASFNGGFGDGFVVKLRILPR